MTLKINRRKPEVHPAFGKTQMTPISTLPKRKRKRPNKPKRPKR